MQDLVRDGMKAGALGLSVSRNQGHFDPQGVHIPAIWADEKEIFALGDVLRDLGTGLIQSGGGNGAEMKDALMSRLREATGRIVVYNNLGQTMRRPGQWQKQIEQVDATTAKRHPRLPDVHAEPHHRLLQDAQHPDLPRHEGVAPDLPVLARGAAPGLCRSGSAQEAARRGDRVLRRPADRHLLTWWDYMVVQNAVLPKNKWMEGKTLGEIAKAQGKGIIDCLCDLTIEENLDTEWLHGENNVDDDAVAQDPDLPERGDRPVGRRRACPVPERLRLLDPAAVGMGARKAGHVAGDRGAAADLRVGLDLRPL